MNEVFSKKKGGDKMDAKLTQDELQAIKERAEKATEGPWVEDDGILRAGFEGDEVFDYSCGVNNAHNAEFIAAARQDIPKLLAEIERLQAEVHEHSAHNGQLIATHVIPTKEENKRLRKALEYYADSRNYQEWRDGYAGSRGTSVEILRDYGRRAGEALRR